VTNKIKKISSGEDSFWAIRSMGKAFVVRSVELALLSVILSLAHFYFPDWNFWLVLAVGILAATTLSFVLYKFLNGKKKNMLGHLSIPEQNPNELKEKNKTFWVWLKSQLLLLTSQLAVVATTLGFLVSFIYYVRHGEYNEYLEAGAVQTGIFWLHIPVLIIFIGWSIWKIKDEIDDEKSRKTFKRIFGRDINLEEIKHSENQQRKFRKWFLIFWISMGCLYGAFIIQRNLGHHNPIGRNEIFRMFMGLDEKEESPNNEEKTKDTESLEEKIEKIEKAVESSPDVETNLSEREIYEEIEKLKSKHLKVLLHEIIKEFKDTEAEQSLKYQEISNSEDSAVDKDLRYKKLSEYKAIYDKVRKAYDAENNERRKRLIEEAKEEIAPFLQSNELPSQEQIIFTKIKNIDLKELEKSAVKINKLIRQLETGKTISKNQQISEKLQFAIEAENPAETKDAIKAAYKLIDKNSKYSETLKDLIFACIIYFFNNLGWWIIFVCFIFITTLNSDKDTLKKESRYLYLSFFGFFLLSAAFPILIFALFFKGTSDAILTSWTAFFDGLSGIINAVILCLLIARLDSKLIGLTSYLIGVLYFYAAFQPLFIVFEQPGEISQITKMIVLVGVFISKIYFFLIITYALKTGRILTYLYCFPNLSKRVDSIYANPYKIECEEKNGDFKFIITKNNEEIYSGEYKNSDEKTFFRKMDELRKVASDRDHVKKEPLSLDEYKVQILGKDGNIICATKDESMSEKKADQLIEDSIKYIPYCEHPQLINKGKKAGTIPEETNEDNSKNLPLSEKIKEWLREIIK
jgi:hypothetical protein